MIVDINDADTPSSLTVDVCIIGSGAIGIALAREFIGSSYRVAVLEGGGRDWEDASQDPYTSEIVGLAHKGVHEGRARALGGTTLLWAGQALPLYEIDFESRPWVPYSGWPIRRTSLDPFYPRAHEVMQLPSVSYEVDSWPISEPPPPYDPDLIHPLYTQFAAVPNFSQKYRTAIQEAPNVTLYTHANVTEIDATPAANAVQSVRVQSFAGKKVVVQSRFFVVCCGGIETARLLLLSRSVEPNGIGNANDMVGRFFQDHPGVPVGTVQPRDPRFRKWYTSFRRNLKEYGWVRYGLKVCGSADWVRREGLLNVGGEVYYADNEDSPVNALKTIAQNLRPAKVRSSEGRGALTKALGKVLAQPHHVANALWQKGVLKQPVSVGEPMLGIGCEQEPNPQSRVKLSNQTDTLGLPRTALEWRLSGAEVHTIEKFLEIMVSEWKRLGIADLTPSDIPIRGRELGKHGGFADANHHIGTTRMGDDPKTSVTDSRCRVHGYDNLYIGGSSLFPTGGFSNPTLTALALCLRTGDELKDRLRASPSVVGE